jgi:recombination protein RecR
MRIAKAIQHLIESFEKLPGIGPKTASRLTFYLLHVPQAQLSEFANALVNLKKKTVVCSVCFNVGDRDPCSVCAEPGRDPSTICVVEEPLDVMAIEKTGKYKGVYHVLGGRIDPLNNIRPEDLKIKELLKRVGENEVNELILATNPDMEGEATAMYLAQKLRALKAKSSKLKALKISRIGRGLPTGGDLEYADEMTLSKALEGRSQY